MKKLHIFALLLACTLAVGCSSSSDDPEIPVNPTPTPTPTPPTPTPGDQTAEELANYKCPTYSDNYTSVAAWTQHSKWNLANMHDPTVVKASDGYYYMYQTDASYGNAHQKDIRNSNKHGHFFCRRSKNLVDWEFVGATMVGLPSWIKTKLNEFRKGMGVAERPDSYFANDLDFGFWAPCVRKVNDHLYRMYYAITCPGTINGDGTWSERAFIGLMETSDPASNKWEDKGYVITNASDKGLNFKVRSNDWANCYFKYNAIDPTYVITPEGKHWLIYGSWHSGFAAVELDANTGKTKATLPNPWGTADDIAAYGKTIFTRTLNNRWQGSEAPEIVYHDGYYYLFVAYDALEVPYNTRVLRSKNVDGPYETMNSKITDAAKGANEEPTVLTHPYKFSAGSGWVGISHCAVFDDGAGNWYYVSQQRMPANVAGIAASNAIMMGGVRSIQWDSNGWPVVMPERYGAVPQAKITASELEGTWEGIELSYEYGKQKTSKTFKLSSNGVMEGGSAWSNVKAWSFDASSNTLTIGTTKLKVQREVDWEASPRKVTIVYSGVSGNRSYWGKKN